MPSTPYNDIAAERAVIQLLQDGPDAGLSLAELVDRNTFPKTHFSTSLWWLLNFANVVDYDFQTERYLLRPTVDGYLARLEKTEKRRLAAAL